jgi:hypothetical protein
VEMAIREPSDDLENCTDFGPWMGISRIFNFAREYNINRPPILPQTLNSYTAVT